MRILFVEDEFREISAVLAQCDRRKWKWFRGRTFYEAYNLLRTGKEHNDLIVVDMMLPWGDADVESVALSEGINWRRSGLLLIEAIRNRPSKELKDIVRETNERKRKSSQSQGGIGEDELLQEALPECYRDVPIIALTKVAGTVEEDLQGIPKITLLSKAIAWTGGESFVSLAERLVKKGD